MARQEKLSPSSPREPDIYRDPQEVIWKFIALNSYHNIHGILEDANAISDHEIQKLQTRTIDAFNSNHSQDIFCRRTELLLQRLNKRLNEIGKSDIYDTVIREVQESRSHINESLKVFNGTGERTTYPIQEQTFIEDGVIEIAGMPLEEFSNQENFFSATLKLFSEEDDQNRAIAESSFHHGFTLEDDEVRLIAHANQENWDVVDLINQQLLNQQITKKYKSLQVYEFLPELSEDQNKQRKKDALEEAYYLMGKITSTIAHYSNKSDLGNSFDSEMTSDPVAMFLYTSGKNITPQQLKSVKRIALAHSSHGLNSGELTAQLAGSVRTTFPRALISSFNIRSGILHAGAVGECMRQTKAFLDCNEDSRTYINGILESGEKLYGFGHRIHKTNPDDPIDVLGKDPRVALYIDACLDSFPEKSAEINKLIEYASTIRQMRPSLGANTDFGASVLFHTLELPAHIANGFFAAFRTPGVCAQIINELSVKGNSRRPPFPPVLPY